MLEQVEAVHHPICLGEGRRMMVIGLPLDENSENNP
jgi:hypothetical protein